LKTYINPARHGISMTGKGRSIARTVIGSVLILIGFVPIVLGGISLVLDKGNADPEGYHPSERYEVRSTTCLFFLNHLPTKSDLPDPEAVWYVEPVYEGAMMFVGWASFTDVAAYTGGVPYETPYEWEWYFSPYSSTIDIPSTNEWNPNGSSPSSPDSIGFWIAKTTTTGRTASLRFDPKWEPEDEMRALVIMNSDGSPNVSADIWLGTKVPMFQVLPYPLIAIGVLVAVIGTAAIAWDRNN